MFKLIITVRKRAGMTLNEFTDYYKTKHLPFLGKTLPHTSRGPTLMRLNIVKPDDPFLKVVGDNRADSNPPFDCISEIGFENREDAEAAMATFFDPKYLDKVKQDERNFVDLSSIRYYVVETGE
jgi:hypothetical protein